MSAAPQNIGNYAIEQELGRGGMGVVYLATDPKLNRRVAIKVLPAEVSRDPQRLARFEREAKLLAALKHPNVGGILGLEEADGQRFLVLEYLEGESLARRLSGGPMRVGEAIHVCKQIAAALEAAHEGGIIHRDLKPGNVMITDDDEVKVLDFGLAKGDASSGESTSDLSASPTMTAGATAAGVILGTAAYMSPEQARGRSLDRRTDIWSFGCVLYECLTGKQLFGGETVSDTIAKILEREPDWEALPKDMPDRIRELLRRCLEKKARERLRDIGDARIELEEVESGKTSSISGMTAGVPLVEHRGKLRLAWGVAAVAAVAAIVAAGASFLRPAPIEPVPMRTEIKVPDWLQIVPQSDNISMSPDGTRIVFVAIDSTGAQHLFQRELASREVIQLPNTQDALHPFWSPDSRHIGFFSNAKLRTMSIDGGSVEVLADVTASRGGSWGKDHILFAGAQGPIFMVPIDGGEVVAVTEVDTAADHSAHRFPIFLPDGRRFLYTVLPPLTANIRVFASDVDRAEPKEIMSARGVPAYVEPGYLLWQRGSRIVAQAFDVSRLEPRGRAFPIGPAPVRADNIGSPRLAVSRSGAFVQLPPSEWLMRLEWQDFNGRTIEQLPLDPQAIFNFDIAPDGRRAIVTISEDDYSGDLWLVDFDRMSPTRLTFGPGGSYQPHWAPDGDRIVYSSDRDGPSDLYVQSVSDPNSVVRLVDTEATFKNAFDWSANDDYVIYGQAGTGTGLDLWIAPTDRSAPAQPYLVTPFNEEGAQISPDGQWCLYNSDESGQTEVYVTTFPRAGPKHRVSTGGGTLLGWRHDGNELFYLAADRRIMRVPVESGARFAVGTPRRSGMAHDGHMYLNVSPVAPRWLVANNEGRNDQRTLIVVTGWQGLADAKN